MIDDFQLLWVDYEDRNELICARVRNKSGAEIEFYNHYPIVDRLKESIKMGVITTDDKIKFLTKNQALESIYKILKFWMTPDLENRFLALGNILNKMEIDPMETLVYMNGSEDELSKHIDPQNPKGVVFDDNRSKPEIELNKAIKDKFQNSYRKNIFVNRSSI